jgi:N-acetylmuramoyl-L-alanine amidase CwlA
VNIIQCYLTANRCYKAKQTIVPKGVMIHSTGANNPNLKRYVQPLKTDANYSSLVAKLGTNANGNHWNRAAPSACVHAFIGKLANGSIATAQTLPWNHRGWHAGSGKKGSANNTHISFEICEDGLSDKTYFNKVYQEAVELTAFLCKKYSLNPLLDGVVICHSEGNKRGIASNHADVMHWFPKHGKSMDTFRKDVHAAMKGKADTAYEQAKKTVKTKAGLADGTMDYLEKYQYAEDLITKLAKAMS